MRCYLDKLEDASREQGKDFDAYVFVINELGSYNEMAEALRELLAALCDADADETVTNLIAGMSSLYLKS